MIGHTYETDLSFGDTVHVPNVSQLTVRTKAADTDATFETFTEVDTDLIVNTHTYVGFELEHIVKVQSKYDLMSKYSSGMGYSLAEDMDTSVTARFDAFSQTVGTLNVGTTYEDWRRAIQYLNDAKAPTENRAIMISPAEMNNLQGIDVFISKDYQVAAFSNSQIGAILGIPVYMTQNLEGDNDNGHDNVLLHKTSLEIVRQLSMDVQSEYVVKRLAWQTIAHQIYGSAEFRDLEGVWVKGK